MTEYRGEGESLPLFDGIAARDEALGRVEEAAPEEWKMAARRAILRLARTRPTLTTDDVWRALDGHVPPEPRALGAIMRQSSDILLRTERTVNSTRPECHRRPVRVWESLIYSA
jgi:hypothetical protein